MSSSDLKQLLRAGFLEMPVNCLWLLNERRIIGNMGSQSCGSSPGDQGQVSSTICSDSANQDLAHSSALPR